MTGGTAVTITGANFTGATAVTFGGLPAAAFSVTSPTAITATSPPGSAGPVDVVITTAAGASATGAPDQFTYVPSATAGGTGGAGTTGAPVAPGARAAPEAVVSGGTGSTAGAGSAGPATVDSSRVTVTMTCTPNSAGTGSDCQFVVDLTIVEHLKGGKVVSVIARRTKAKPKVMTKVVTLGIEHITVAAGAHRTVTLSLNGAGRRLLASRHRLHVKLTIAQSVGGATHVVTGRTLTFATRPGKKKRAR